MATRPLMNVEALPALRAVRARTCSSSAARTTVPGRGVLGTRRAGARRGHAGGRRRGHAARRRATPASSAISPRLARRATPRSCSWLLHARGMYSWRFRVSTLDDLRGILTATVARVDGRPRASASCSGRRGRPRAAVAAAAGPSAPSTSPPAASPTTGRSSRARRHGDAGQADADRRRRPRRPADGAAPARAPRARPAAGRLPRQGAAGRARPARARPRRELGSRAADRAARDRARRRHLLDGAERGAAARGRALRGARRLRLARPAPVRARRRAADASTTSAACRSSRRSASIPKGWQFAVKYTLDRVVARRCCCSRCCRSSARSRCGDAALARPPDLLPPAPHRPRRPRVRDAEVPLDARSCAEPASTVPDAACADTAPGGVEGDDRRTRVRRASCAAPRSTSCRSC